jgi:predicted membrane chloride channel (bestrophin family)
MVRSNAFSQTFCSIESLLPRILGREVARYKNAADYILIDPWGEAVILHNSSQILEGITVAILNAFKDNLGH